MRRRIFMISLCVVLLISAMSGCGASVQESATQMVEETQEMEEAGEEESDFSGWMLSNLTGSVTAETQVDKKDDFYTAVNKDWLASAKIPAGYVQTAPPIDRVQEVKEQMKALMTDQTQTSHEAELVQTLYSQYMDMETRNELGMEPLRQCIDEIQALETIDEVRRYIGAFEQYWVNMSAVAKIPDAKDSSIYLVYVAPSAFSLDDADEYRSMTSVGERKKSADENMIIELLVHAGMTQEEAKEINDRFFALETKIAEASMGISAQQEPDYLERIYNPMTVEEIMEISPNYPLINMLQTYLDAGVERFNIMEPEWLKRMNELFVEENVEDIKACLIRNTAMEMSLFLDQTSMELSNERYNAIYGLETELIIEKWAYDNCASENSLLGMAAGKMYVDAYVSEKTKTEVTDIAQEVIAVYKRRLENNEWLTEETRKNAIEKLDNIELQIAYPDDWSLYDFSGLEFKSTEEGGSLIENYKAMYSYSVKMDAGQAILPVDREQWIIPPQTVNAFYYMSGNSITILAGYLGGELYDPEAPIEKKLATIGCTIGHEISHGFDNNGSNYDKDGNQVNWWTQEDKASFEERVSEVSAYFSQFETLPDLYVNGELVRGEAVADLGGMSCMLEIANGIEDFDYEMFFETYAKDWRQLCTKEYLEDKVLTDGHPLSYLRVNAIVQQFEEFYDTYGIKEGDGMYLAPEKRLAVW